MGLLKLERCCFLTNQSLVVKIPRRTGDKDPLEVENLIKYYLKKKGMSYADLSVLCNVSSNSLQGYASGKNLPNVIFGIRMAEAFGIDVKDLFKDLGWEDEEFERRRSNVFLLKK